MLFIAKISKKWHDASMDHLIDSGVCSSRATSNQRLKDQILMELNLANSNLQTMKENLLELDSFHIVNSLCYHDGYCENVKLKYCMVEKSVLPSIVLKGQISRDIISLSVCLVINWWN